MKPHALKAFRYHPRITPVLSALSFSCSLFALVLPIGQRTGFGASAGNPKEDAQSLWPAKDYASTRYSDLADISNANVKQLKVAWSFSTGVNRGQEAAPLVVGSTMYVVTPYPNILYALDLSRAGPPLKWKYEPNPAAAAQGVACCDVVNRGAAYTDGKIVFNRLDVQTVAVDANSGKEIWKTKLGDINRGETITMAPLIVKNKVLVGNSGGEIDRAAVQAVLQNGSGKRSRCLEQAARCQEDRRRHGLGLDLLRSGARSHLLRYQQSWTLESRATSGRQ
jgi:glucose dehydrogenase